MPEVPSTPDGVVLRVAIMSHLWNWAGGPRRVWHFTASYAVTASAVLLWSACSASHGGRDRQRPANDGGGSTATPEGGRSGDDHDAGVAGEGGSSGSAATPGGGRGGDDHDAGMAADGGGETHPPANVPAFESGSRLRARIWVGSDGSRHFAGFRDTHRGIDCEFGRFGSAGIRCAPLVVPHQYVAFSDAECSELVIGTEACPPPAYATIASGSCDRLSRERIVRIDPLGPMPEAIFSHDYSNQCTWAAMGEREEWRPATEVDPGLFQEAALARVELGGGLALQRFVASDGASQSYALWFDGEPCDPVEVTGAGTRCAPRLPTPVHVQGFADDECTQAVVNLPLGEGCAPPRHGAIQVTQPQLTGCPATTVFELRDPGDSLRHVDGESAQCVASARPSETARGRRAVRLAEADPSVLPSLELVPRGDSRLQALLARTEDGSAVDLVPTRFYDSELGVPCSRETFEDGSVRCVPHGPRLASAYYADPACTMRLASLFPCEAESVYLRETVWRCGDWGVRQVFEPSGSYAGPIYFREDATTCSPTDWRPPAGLALVAVTPVDTGAFVRLSEEAD